MASIGNSSQKRSSSSPGKPQPHDGQSTYENNYAAQTAADSLTVKDKDEHRQSFGNIRYSKPNQMIGTDFTVAEELHRRHGAATPQDFNDHTSLQNVREQPHSQTLAATAQFNGRHQSAQRTEYEKYAGQQLRQQSQPVMKRRLESRSRKGRSRAGAKSAARIFSSTANRGAKNLEGVQQHNLTLNASSGQKMPQQVVNPGSVSVHHHHHHQASGANDSVVQGGGATVEENATTGQTIEEGAVRNAKFDPSKFISEDFLQILNEHRKNCEREGKLQQATLARKRLKELRIFEEQKRKEETQNRHRHEMEALENAHKGEICELQNKWNNVILPQSENEAALIEMELKQKHQKELDSFRVAIENGTVQCPRLHFSGAVIEMQRRADYLGQGGFYKDAKILKKQIKAAKGIEREKYNLESRQKLFRRSEDLIKRHEKEMTTLQLKHASQRQSLLQARKKEFEVIEMRFVNVWNEMASRFKKEINDMEKHSSVKKMQLKAKNRLPVGIVL